MRNIIQLLLVSCSILATEAYAGSSDDDGSSLKRSIAKLQDATELQSQAAKRKRSSDGEGEAEQSTPKSAAVEVSNPENKDNPLYFLALIPLNQLEGDAARVIGRLNAEGQNVLSLVNKHHYGLVLNYRMAHDPRQLHLNPWVLLPGWGETNLYRLNAAVFHGARAMMSAQVVNEGEDSSLREGEWADYAKPIRKARKFISGTFGEAEVLGSITSFFAGAEQQLLAEGKFDQTLPFPQQIADSAIPGHKSEYDLLCLHRYLTAEPTASDEFEAFRARWLKSDSETNPYRMNLPKRNAYVYDLQNKMGDSQQYTPEEREEFARKSLDLMLDSSLDNEIQSIIDVLVEVGQYTLAAEKMNWLIETNGGPDEYLGRFEVSDWANMNFHAGNYEKVAEIYEWAAANTTHQFDLKDYTRLNETYSTIWRSYANQMMAYQNQMKAYKNQGEQDKVLEMDAKLLEMDAKLLEMTRKIVETIQRGQKLRSIELLTP